MPKHNCDRKLVYGASTWAGVADRRHVLQLLAGVSLFPFVACDDNGKTGDNPNAADAGDSESAPCTLTPQETAGPFPGNGSNGPNALALNGIIRRDIRTSIEPSSGTAEGVPLAVRLTLVNTNQDCAPLAARAIHVWHCDRDANYSLYTLPAQNYLRGVQETDSSGTATFTTIFPGCYPGRMPHIHLEVYPSLAAATASGSELLISQLAFPVAVCEAVYETPEYAQSAANLSQISFATDGVFRDGFEDQLATVTGDIKNGFVAELTVRIAI